LNISYDLLLQDLERQCAVLEHDVVELALIELGA
jgi:hypothetical protein